MADTDNAPSLRDAISAAIETHETPEAAAVVVEEAKAAPEVAPEGVADEQAAPADKTRDEKGRFAPKATDSPKAKASAASPRAETGGKLPPSADSPASAAVQAPTPGIAPPPDDPRAPAAWKALSREHWSKVPPEIQRELVKRENEVNVRLQQDAEARNGFQMFQRVVGPYEGLIRARGAEPIAVVDSAVRAYVGLHTSPPHIQAQMLANMAHGLGVPVDALDQALANLLGGKQPPQQQPQQPVIDEAAIERRLLERFEKQRTLQEVNSWSSGKEFLDEVRETMQGLLLAAAQRGQELTLDQAYERACRAEPDISHVLEQRKAAEAQKAQSAKVAQVRNAASSVTPRPAVVMNGEGPKGMRDYIEAAIQLHSGR